MATNGSLGSRRGYVFTVSTFFLMGLVLLLAIFFTSKAERIDITGPKLAMLYDDLRTDIAGLIGLEIGVSKDVSANVTHVTFKDNMMDPSADYRVQNYEHYIESNYSKLVGRDIDNREGSLAGADIHLDLSNATFPIRPFGYSYAYGSLLKKELFIYPNNGSTPFTESLINITLGRNVTNLTWDVSLGNTSYWLYVTYWNNNTFDRKMYISDNGSSSWRFGTLDGNVTLVYGPGYAGGDYHDGVSYLQVEGNITIGVETTLTFNGTASVEVSSQFTAEIMDILGKAWLIRPLYLFREG